MVCIETTLTIATLTSYVSLVGSDIEYGVCIETTLTIATLTSYVSLVGSDIEYGVHRNNTDYSHSYFICLTSR